MPEILHLKESSAWNIGPDIRKCTECGTRLWIPSDGTWTEERRTWENPPEGYANCAVEYSAPPGVTRSS